MHYVRREDWETEPKVAICGESASRTLLEGTVGGYYRHVYVTLSIEKVNCPVCAAYVGLLILRDTSL